MIKPMIQQLARKKGIKNAFGLQRALGVSPTVATKLWRGNFAMIGLSTLDRLCELLDCYVGDLLKYEPSGLSLQGQSSNDGAVTDEHCNSAPV